MNVVGETRSVSDGELALEVDEHRIGVGRRQSDGHPSGDAKKEEFALSSDECRNDSTIEIGHVEREHGAKDEESAMYEEERRFFRSDRGNDDAKYAIEAFEELRIDLCAFSVMHYESPEEAKSTPLHADLSSSCPFLAQMHRPLHPSQS